MRMNSRLILLVLVFPIVLLYQNCSCSARQDFSQQDLGANMSGSSSGNGQPYEGKPEPGTYYRVVPELKCGGPVASIAEISVSANEIKLKATDPSSCRETELQLTPDLVESVIYNKSYLGHGSGIFEKLDRPPAADATETSFNETWCRLQNPAQRSYDVVVRESLPSERISLVIRGATYSPANQLNLEPERIVENVVRRLESTALSYTTTDFDLQVDLTREAAPGKFQGKLKYRKDASVDAVICRTGAKLDQFSEIRPVLALDLSKSPLPPALSVTRASAASYYDNAGTLRFAAIDEARFDTDPSTLESRGLLIEGEATNSLPNSRTLASFWTRSATQVPNAAVAPDGTTSAVRLIEANSITETQHQAGFDAILEPGVRYTLSYYVKAGSRPATELGVTNLAGVMDVVNFDLVNGKLLEGPTTSSIKEAGIEAIRGGWYRVWASFDSSTGVTQPVISLRTHKGTAPWGGTYIGDGSSDILIWGAQLERGPRPTSFITTSATGVTRSADNATLANVALIQQSEGTLLMRAGRHESSNATGFASGPLFELIGSGTDSYSVALANTPSSALVGEIHSSDGRAARFEHDILLPSSRALLLAFAFAYKAGDTSLIANGTSTLAPTNAPIGLTPMSFAIGGNSRSERWSAHVRSLSYWPKRLSDETLRRLVP